MLGFEHDSLCQQGRTNMGFSLRFGGRNYTLIFCRNRTLKVNFSYMLRRIFHVKEDSVSDKVQLQRDMYVYSWVWNLETRNLTGIQSRTSAFSLCGRMPYEWVLTEICKGVPLVEFMYLAFTRMPGQSFRRRFRSLLLCPLLFVWCLLNVKSPCWFYVRDWIEKTSLLLPLATSPCTQKLQKAASVVSTNNAATTSCCI